MSTDKTKTPSSSPKSAKSSKLGSPSTPPSGKGRKRISAYLSTPDQFQDTLPFSPGLKRSNSGSIRSPDQKQNEMQSPYNSNSLRSPRNGDYDWDDKETPRRSKLMKTPQYFSTGKKLFSDDSSPTKKELGEISSQLKSRLSSAFGSLQQKERTGFSPVKLDFSDSSHMCSKESPTKLFTAMPPSSRTNINLQTLQSSPNITSKTSKHFSAPADLSKHSYKSASEHPHISIPSPDEESSAHNALLAAFSRAKERRKSHSSEKRRPSVTSGLSDPSHPLQSHSSSSTPTKLPPISVRTPANRGENSEQEAVYSLMSLSSPQSKKHDVESPKASISAQFGTQMDMSSASSRSSSIAMPVLPPISGIMRKFDNDETDIEDATASEDDTS